MSGIWPASQGRDPTLVKAPSIITVRSSSDGVGDMRLAGCCRWDQSREALQVPRKQKSARMHEKGGRGSIETQNRPILFWDKPPGWHGCMLPQSLSFIQYCGP